MSNVKLKNELTRQINSAIASGVFARLCGGLPGLEVSTALKDGAIGIDIERSPVDLVSHDVLEPSDHGYVYKITFADDSTPEGAAIKAALREIAERVIQRHARYRIHVTGRCMGQQVDRMRAGQSVETVTVPPAAIVAAPAADLFAAL
jgi:hypothetical protein